MGRKLDGMSAIGCVLAAVCGASACGGSGGNGGPPRVDGGKLDGGGAVSSGGSGGTGGLGGNSGGAGGNTGGTSSGGTSSGGTSGGCNATANEDKDQDGFSIADGDCNDCNPKVNPGAVEIIDPATAIDDDCDGKTDFVEPACDDALDVASADPTSAAKAIDLCKTASTGKTWGVVSAKWVLADGSPPPTPDTDFHLGHGILNAFGSNVSVQAGKRMLALSSGTARQPTDAGYQNVSGFDKQITGNAPLGFPKESPACPGVVTGTPHDAAGLELTIRVPTNAVGFAYDFKFYTYEWPTYICTVYNDFFVAILSPTPSGQTDGNIAFDPQGNVMSVNSSLLDVCGCTSGPPCTAGTKSYPCALGTTDLVGTGFDTPEFHGATGWLTTSAPAQPGSEITLRFAIYDSSDGVLDSTVLIDNWHWLTSSAPSAPTTIPKP